MARSYLAAVLNRPQDAAGWLRHGPPDAFSRRLLAPAIPFAHICRARLLLLERKPKILIDESEAVIGLTAGLKYVLALIYGHIHVSAALIMRRKNKEAASSLRKALDLALPDALYLPFAECGGALLPMLERLQGDFDSARMDAFIALCRRWSAGVATLRRALPSATSVLTPRQREIALLIREGLSAKKIAEKLFLSEGTVATVRKTIYSKLHINSNIELVQVKL